MATTSLWEEVDRCPFCGAQLPSPGEGFVRHLDDRPECHTEFERWRRRVAGDVKAGWPG